MTDPIADMLTRIRNAQKARKPVIEVACSKLKMTIASILVKEGYLVSAEKRDGMPSMLVITLRYDGKRPAIQDIRRESTPGHRQYRKATDMPKILNDFGIAVVSTSKGIMTNKEARKQGIGGELICSVY